MKRKDEINEENDDTKDLSSTEDENEDGHRDQDSEDWIDYMRSTDEAMENAKI